MSVSFLDNTGIRFVIFKSTKCLWERSVTGLMPLSLFSVAVRGNRERTVEFGYYHFKGRRLIILLKN